VISAAEVTTILCSNELLTFSIVRHDRILTTSLIETQQPTDNLQGINKLWSPVKTDWIWFRGDESISKVWCKGVGKSACLWGVFEARSGKIAPKSDCNIVISRGPTLVEWTGAKNFIMLFRGLLKANSPTAKVRRNDAALKSLSTGSRLNIRFSSKSVTSIWFKLLDIV